MALYTDINDVAARALTLQKSKNVRRYRVGSSDDFIDYIETITVNEFEYPAMTKEAAEASIVNIGPGFSAQVVEDVRNVEAYKVIVTQETKSTVEAARAPAPNVGSVTFSITTGSVASFPQTVTISSSNSSDKIWYRIDSLNNAGNYTPGTYTEGSSNNITIQANTDIFALGYQGKHKQVRITAQARRTQLTGDIYVGAESSIRLFQIIPNFGEVTFNPSGGSDNVNALYVTFPLNVQVTAPSGATGIFAQAFYFNGNTYVNQFAMSDVGNSPATVTLNPVAYSGSKKLAGLGAFPYVVFDGIYYRNGQSYFNPNSPPAIQTTPQKYYKNY